MARLEIALLGAFQVSKEGKLVTDNELHYPVYEYLQENYEVLATTDNFFIYKLSRDTDV